ncbi:DNA-directed RNA polymerase subunit beta [Bacillus sp. MUM 13]|uniref:DNA-directed RNA polymerase subunit beta n=1 Tax=Bacillus sp. MUM 13 TaxID=1678001 RepID=UPI0008F571EE|nr:DNA-directed RNA polymerase subunit beta [Bacillus sp. MUM 13]OIK10093.1 hydroxymyristoyl-ACP dehydratase [Bacillus sp. MUM 13]
MPENNLTREEYKQKAGKEKNKNKRIRIRLLPIWLRLLIVAGLIAVCTISGAIVGYSVIGGGNAMDVFHKSTWTHITDIVNKDTNPG